MASIADQMTRLYCFTDDFLQAHPTLANWRRSPNCSLTFTDAEVLTVAADKPIEGADFSGSKSLQPNNRPQKCRFAASIGT